MSKRRTVNGRRAKKAAVTSPVSEQTGCMMLRPPVVGDSLWRDDGVLPSHGAFTLWIVCEL